MASSFGRLQVAKLCLTSCACLGLKAAAAQQSARAKLGSESLPPLGVVISPLITLNVCAKGASPEVLVLRLNSSETVVSELRAFASMRSLRSLGVQRQAQEGRSGVQAQTPFARLSLEMNSLWSMITLL